MAILRSFSGNGSGFLFIDKEESITAGPHNLRKKKSFFKKLINFILKLSVLEIQKHSIGSTEGSPGALRHQLEEEAM